MAFTVHFKLLLSELRKFKDSLPESIAQDGKKLLSPNTGPILCQYTDRFFFFG